MPNSGIIVAILFVLGMIMLCGFLTPFIHNDYGNLIHSNIFFVGKFIVGQFLIYVVILTAMCIGVAKMWTAKNSR